MRKYLRSWQLVSLFATAVVVGAAYLAADWYAREPPNYTRIEDGLYLGGYVQSPPPGTGAVLNLDQTADPYEVDVARWEPIRDGTPLPTLAWLRQQVEFIAAQRALERVVYVHCRNGVSRSGMVLAAYLMWRDGRSRDEALEYLRVRRPGVRPNPEFMRLLREWQTALHETAGVRAATAASWPI